MYRLSVLKSLVMLLSGACIFGAADNTVPSNIAASTLRVLDLISSVHPALALVSPNLAKGMRYLSPKGKDFKKAEAFLKAAKVQRIPTVDSQIDVGRAAMLFVGGDGILKDEAKAYVIARENIRLLNAGLVPVDYNNYINAYLIFDEIAHALRKDAGTDIPLLRDFASKVKAHDIRSNDEFYYRLARGLCCDGGQGYERSLEVAAMCLNSILITQGTQPPALICDTNALRHEVVKLAGGGRITLINGNALCINAVDA